MEDNKIQYRLTLMMKNENVAAIEKVTVQYD